MLDKVISPKLAAEKIVITFDFTDELGSLNLSTITSTTVEVMRGTDAAPSAMINGSGAIDSSGKMALVPVIGGAAGNIYRIRCYCQTSNSSVLLGRSAVISIE